MRTVNFILSLGNKTDDKPDVLLQKNCLISQATLMSCGGILWGIMCFSVGMNVEATVPLGYVAISVFNLLYFYKTKNFTIVKNIQTTISLFLPFIFQWVLGGFVASGAVMLWALLSLAVCVMYLNGKEIIFWLVLYIFLTIVSAVFDSEIIQLIKSNSVAKYSILFFAVNIIVISSIVLWLVNFMYKGKNAAMQKLYETQQQLIESEKLAALGTVATRVAHEILNPINFVNNFSQLSEELVTEMVDAKNDEERKETAKILTENLEKIKHHGKRADDIVKELFKHTREGTAHEYFDEEKK